MADPNHVRLVKRPDRWKEWRSQNYNLHPDLSEAELIGADLSYLNLSGANLDGARLAKVDLRWANLMNATLSKADLSGANLANARLERVDLSSSNLAASDLSSANLSNATLLNAFLIRAKLNNANLFEVNAAGANFTDAELVYADLREANLLGAVLSRSNFGEAQLVGANLSAASLTNARFYLSSFLNVNLTRAQLFETTFDNVDLSGVRGLATCVHLGASAVDVRTLMRSGRLPLEFMRGVGLPDHLIDYLPSLLDRPIQHYSCFISFSSKDQEFANRIHADLQNGGVRCWFAPHDMPIGGKIWDEIDAAIRLRDKVVLILSKHAIKSDWVEDEVTKAFEEERERHRTVLFPIRLDDEVIDTEEPWATKLRRDRNIGDFRRWKEHDEYQKSFDRVLRDLTVKKE